MCYVTTVVTKQDPYIYIIIIITLYNIIRTISSPIYKTNGTQTGGNIPQRIIIPTLSTSRKLHLPKPINLIIHREMEAKYDEHSLAIHWNVLSSVAQSPPKL